MAQTREGPAAVARREPTYAEKVTALVNEFGYSEAEAKKFLQRLHVSAHQGYTVVNCPLCGKS